MYRYICLSFTIKVPKVMRNNQNGVALSGIIEIEMVRLTRSSGHAREVYIIIRAEADVLVSSALYQRSPAHMFLAYSHRPNLNRQMILRKV